MMMKKMMIIMMMMMMMMMMMLMREDYACGSSSRIRNEYSMPVRTTLNSNTRYY